MPKLAKDTKLAKQNRDRVNHHRNWNKILKRDSIVETVQSDLVTNIQNSSDVEMDCSSNENKHQNDTKIAAQEQLRRWALQYNISKCAFTALLKILISIGLTWLPKDSRSVFQTPRYVELCTLTNGKLW